MNATTLHICMCLCVKMHLCNLFLYYLNFLCLHFNAFAIICLFYLTAFIFCGPVMPYPVKASHTERQHTHTHTNDCTKWMPQQAVIHLFIYICMYVCACVAHEMHFTTITCALRCFIFLYIYPLFFMRSNTFYLHRYHLCCHAALSTCAFFYLCSAFSFISFPITPCPALTALNKKFLFRLNIKWLQLHTHT